MDAAVDAAVKKVTAHVDFAKTFRHPLKFDGTNFVETRLSTEEQHAEVTKLASKSLHVFLERYGKMLPADDVRALGANPAVVTAETQFWIERLLREPLSNAKREKQNRRRRWEWARREMKRPDGFFCEDDMKRRDPRLFHHIIGCHLDSNIQLSAPMQGNLSSYLMRQLDNEIDGGENAAAALDSEVKDKYPNGADGREDGKPTNENKGDHAVVTKSCGSFEGDNDNADAGPPSSPSDDGEVGTKVCEGAAPDDIAARRAKFLKVMRDRFVNGQEPKFKYSNLDDDSELDDVVEVGRDAEDRYFNDE